MDNWESEKEILLQKINNLQEEINALKGKSQTARKQLKYTPQFTPQKSVCSTPQKSVSSTPQKLYNKIRDLKEEQKELIDFANTEKRTLEREITAQKDRYELQIKDLKHSKSTLFNEKKQLEKSVDKLKSRISNLEQSEKKCVILSSELSKERFEKNKMQAELDEIKKKRNEMTAFTNRLKQQIKELKEGTKVDTPAKRSSPTAGKYAAQIMELKEKNNILVEYQINAENIIENLRNKVDELADREAMSTSLTTALKAAEEEMIKLREDWDNLYKTKEVYVHMVNDLKNKLDQLTEIMENKKQMEVKCWIEKEQLFKELILLKDQHETTCRELKILKESRKIEMDLKEILIQANQKKDLIKSKALNSSSENTPSDLRTDNELNMESAARKCLNFENQTEVRKDSEYFDCIDIVPLANDVPNPGDNDETLLNVANTEVNNSIIEIDALKKEVDKLKIEKQNLEKELTAKIKYLEQSIESTKCTYEERVKKLQDEKELSNIKNQKEIENLQAEIINQEKKRCALLKEINKYKTECSSLENSLLKSNSDYKALKDEKEISNFEKDKDIFNLSEKLKHQEKKIARLIEESNKKDSIFVKEKENLQKCVDQLETECSLLKNETNFRNNDKHRELPKLAEKLQMFENKLAALMKNIAEKEYAFSEEKRDFQEIIAKFTTECECLKNEKSVIEKDSQDKICKLQEQLNEQRENIAELKKIIVEKEKMCSDLTTCIDTLKSDYSFINQEKIISDTECLEKLAEFEETIKNQNNTITDLTAELKLKEIQCADYTKCIEQLQLEMNEFTKEDGKLKSERQNSEKELTTKIKYLEQSIETNKCTYEKRIKMLQDENTLSKIENQKEIGNLQAEIIIKEKEKYALLKQINKYKTECSSLENSVSKLDSALKNKSIVEKDTQKKIYELQEQLKAQQNNISELTTEMKHKEDEKTELMKNIKTLTSDYSRLHSEKVALDTENQNKLSELRKKLKEKENHINNLVAEVNQKGNEWVDYEKLKSDYDVLMKVKNDLENGTCELKEKLKLEEERATLLTSELRIKEEECSNLAKSVENLRCEIKALSDEKDNLENNLKNQKCLLPKEAGNLNEIVKCVHKPTDDIIQIECVEYVTPLENECSKLKNENMFAEIESPSVKLLKEQVIRLEEQVSRNREKLAIARNNENELNLKLFKYEKTIEDCQIDIRILKREQNDTMICLDNTKMELKQLQQVLFEEKSERESLENKLKDVFNELRIKDEELILLSKENSSKDNKLEDLQEKLDEAQKQYNMLENDHNSLKDTTTMLEYQIIGFEKMTDKLTDEKQIIEEENKLLKTELEKQADIIKSVRKDANEEKSLRAFSQRKQTEMESTIDKLESETLSLKNEISVKSDEIENLQKEVTNNTSCIAGLESNLNKYRETARLSENEIENLKCERTKLLTELYELRKENANLYRDLQVANEKLTNAENKISQLQSALTNLEMFREEENLICETTLKQQSKLIHYVQSKLVTDARKKKTFTNKFFKSKQKENLNPKDIEYLLEMERQKCKGLQAELYKLRLENYALRNNMSSCQLTPKKLAKISANFTETPDSKSAHRFEQKFCNDANIKCSQCDDIIPERRMLYRCVRCNLYVHVSCYDVFSSTECVVNDRQISSKVNAIIGNDKIVKQAPVKYFDQNGKRWIWMLANLTERWLVLYDDVDADEPKREFAVPLESILSVSDRGIPFNVESPPECYSFIITVKDDKEPNNIILATPEKTDWLNMINITLKRLTTNGVVSQTTNDTGDIGLEEDIVFEEYSVLDKCNVHINCIIQLSSKVCIIGADEGLFSLKLSSSENTEPLTLLSDVYNVRKINVWSKLRIVLFICVKNGVYFLMKCDLRELLTNAEASACLKPFVTFEKAISIEDFENCSSITPICDSYIAAALPTYIAILEWDQTTRLFSTVKQVIETKTGVTAMLYTGERLLFATNEGFFNAVLSQHQNDAEKIVLEDNKNLTVDCRPIDVLKIGKNKFLACNNFVGVYLNEKCERIKFKPVKWYSVPRSIAFSDPFIMTSHESYVVLMYLSRDKNIWTHKIVTFDDPIILGISNYTMGGIYLVIKKNEEDGTRYNKCILFDGTVVRNRGRLSLTSSSTPSFIGSECRMTDELNISSGDLSVSSSMFETNAMEGDDESDSLPRKKKVCFKMSIRRSISLPSLND